LVAEIREIAPGYLRRRYAIEFEEFTPEMVEKDKKDLAARKKKAESRRAKGQQNGGSQNTGSTHPAQAAIQPKSKADDGIGKQA
ncbi:MAG: hypothetical protein V3S29_01460, partial [bacterium]